ncbi:MAG TPA: hypothetical protein VK885_05905 [Desulfotignum sp.]|jgi:hypothetical protein|nr:hypothetical protein [Desulfotignum sp.]
MHKTLQKQYLVLVMPGLGLFLALGLAHALNLVTPGRFALLPMAPGMVFIGAAVTALAGPLFLRTLFAHSVRSQKTVPAADFLCFQRRLLWVSQATPYLAFVAVLFEFPRFYAVAIVLMGLYAMYYYFPSQQRIGFDKKIFRVT